MKTNLVYTAFVFLLCLNSCYSQPGNAGMNPPGIEDRLKLVDKEICQPLKLDKTQKEKVSAAFNDFFVELDKIATPPAMPEKTKVDALSKKRDEKVKQAIPAALYPKYLELEMATRPKGPQESRP